MGVNSRMVRLLSDLKQRGSLQVRSVAEMGAQQLSDDCLRDKEGLSMLAGAFGVPSPRLPEPVDPSDWRLNKDAPPASLLYRALGAEYMAIDIDGTPDAVSLDLNYDSVPRRLRGRFDLVTNFGTTEHVANQLNAFAVIHDLTRVGGVMLHELPSQGQLNHGLVNYNPKWFWMLARSNDYEWLYFDFWWDKQGSGMPANVEAEISKYTSLDGRPPFVALDGALIVALRKKRNRRYIPPVDVMTGTKATNRRLYRRYPTAFAGVQRSRKKLP